MIDGGRLEVLSEAECFRLLAAAPVGRVVYTDRALPAISVVNHVLHEGEIVFRSLAGGKLDAATRRSVVAFQVDSVDAEHETGWSVVALGEATRVTDRVETELLSTLPLRTWLTPVDTGAFVRIRIQLVSGRRLVRERLPGPDVPDAAQAVPS